MKRQIFYACLWLGIALAFSAPVYGQSNGFEIPRGTISIGFVEDNQCPLIVSGPARIIGFDNGDLLFGYNLTNASKVSIVSFEIKELNWFDTRNYKQHSQLNGDLRFPSKQTRFTLSETQLTDLRPFDREVFEKSALADVSNKYWVVMVTKVRLSDGTLYDSSNQLERVRTFLAGQGERIKSSPEETVLFEQKLKTFVRSLY